MHRRKFEWSDGIVISQGTYDDYLRSGAWKQFRRRAILNAQNKCQRCGWHAGLEVHHRHYETLGDERLSDVDVLCRKCHKKADTEREEDAIYWNGLSTYVEKKYGNGADPNMHQEEFDDWLEEKEEDGEYGE